MSSVKTSPRYPEALIFKIRGVRDIKILAMIKDQVFADSQNWTGAPTCTPVFIVEYMAGTFMNCVFSDDLFPYDSDAIERILLTSDDFESIQHRRNYGPDDKPKPRKIAKKKSDGPFSKHGHDLSKFRPSLHPFFDSEDLVKEGVDLKQMMKGYPFKDRSSVENTRFIEMEIIHRMRDRFPTMYDLNRILEGTIVDCLRIIADAQTQKHGRADDFNLAHCFTAVQPPNVVLSAHAHLKSLGWLIKTGRIDRFHKRKTVVDPSDEEASEDKLFMRFGGGVAATHDRDVTDDIADAEEEALH